MENWRTKMNGGMSVTETHSFSSALGPVSLFQIMRDTKLQKANTPQQSVEDCRPKTSPYTSSTSHLYFGKDKVQYKIPTALLPPSLASTEVVRNGSRTVQLPDIDPDIAHPLVHFLHTGTYETLWSGEPTSKASNIREHKRALSLYATARRYGLQELQSLAKQKIHDPTKQQIHDLDSDVPVCSILKHIEAAFPNTCDSDEWLENYLMETLRRTSLEDANTPHQELESPFARAVVRGAVALFTEMRPRQTSTETAPKGHEEESYCIPEPPEQPAGEEERSVSPEVDRSEGDTRSSLSLISCNSDADLPAESTDYDPVLDPWNSDAQPTESGDTIQWLKTATDETAAAEDDSWSISFVPKKKKKAKKATTSIDEPEWTLPVPSKKGSKKKKKKAGSQAPWDLDG